MVCGNYKPVNTKHESFQLKMSYYSARELYYRELNEEGARENWWRISNVWLLEWKERIRLLAHLTGCTTGQAGRQEN